LAVKFSLRAGSILTALALSVVGCDPAEPTREKPKPEGHATSKQGPPSPEAPVVPAPNVSLPSTSKAERDAAEKQAEAKPTEKKDEPKVEAPK
jgi:hypothetical protein